MNADFLSGQFADVRQIINIVPDVVIELNMFFEPFLHSLFSINSCSGLPTNKTLIHNKLGQFLLLLPNFPFLINHNPEKQPPAGQNNKDRKRCGDDPNSSQRERIICIAVNGWLDLLEAVEPHLHALGIGLARHAEKVLGSLVAEDQHNEIKDDDEKSDVCEKRWPDVDHHGLQESSGFEPVEEIYEEEGDCDIPLDPQAGKRDIIDHKE